MLSPGRQYQNPTESEDTLVVSTAEVLTDCWLKELFIPFGVPDFCVGYDVRAEIK